MSTTLATFNDLPFAGFKIEAKPTGTHMWGLWFGDIILADAMAQDEATYFAAIHNLRVEDTPALPFAVGDTFTFIGESHLVCWKLTGISNGVVTFDHPVGGRITGPMFVGQNSLVKGMQTDSARRVTNPATNQ